MTKLTLNLKYEFCYKQAVCVYNMSSNEKGICREMIFNSTAEWKFDSILKK